MDGIDERHRTSSGDELMGDSAMSPKEEAEWPAVLENGWGEYLKVSLKAVLLGSPMNIAMLLTPLALAAPGLGWGHGVSFFLALLALCPFAERIAFVTEDLAKYTNDTLGGLLNATFGNITEVIVALFALEAGLLRVVQVSMLGSILSNLLLVLGCAFIAGGMKKKEQLFNATAANTNCGLLVFSVLVMAMPSMLTATHHGSSQYGTSVESINGTITVVGGGQAPLSLSRFVSCVMLFMYAALIYFQLKTHTYLFEGQEDDDDDPPELGFWGGITWLGIITVFIAVLSDVLVDAIEGAATELDIPILFIGTILLPIVGNAAEHAAAVLFAMRSKMEISLGIAVGSSVQISLFVIPLCVLLAWGMGQPLSLDFHPFETSVLLTSVIMVSVVLADGKAHWMKGLSLVCAYICIGAAFWAHEDPPSMM